MEIQKQFSFVGSLKKLHEDDNQPIENFSASIQCHKNGSIFLEIGSMLYERLNHKKFYESESVYRLTNSPELTQDKLEDPFFLLQLDLDKFEKELVQPYEGNYAIEGRTLEGWVTKAEIADPNFTASSKREVAPEVEDTIQKYLVRLENLSVDYHPDCTEGRGVEAVYGLANLQLIQNLSTRFLKSKYEFGLASLASIGRKDYETLSAEMTLKVIDENEIEVISYSTYFAWFELLISFATGKYLKEIYRIEISQSSGGRKKVEYWPGSQCFKRGRGIAVMQQAHLVSFIEQCASKVTWENFSDKDKGLGSALRWYTETFSSDAVSVEFILLCTVLETLNKHHSMEISSRLLPKSTYKEIRKQILNVLDEYEQSLDNEEIVSQYQIFKKKVEASFAEGSFNQIGSLRTSLKLMFEFYKTPYEDLFPNLEFIAIRDDIVHTGFGGDNIFSDLRKLGNLVVRLVLSILQYRGDYIESRKIEINGLVDFEKHGLAYKTFPFKKDR
ncbi:hypothetical protein [Leptolyngbya sp. FACHB-711]|uniref:hypothetical protein n=1 Tax=Leptolyngbya sp. FACHB-711 TaxID=2692813 RepID=UPI0016894BFA|nr:hypothetical protein [Leptolyngbya sp. FACHB-711]MBD2025483.1 hypothetical protein [Leptolyngbya sp. FACHB-711]